MTTLEVTSVTTVTVVQAYRYALDPSASVERDLAAHAGAARFAYNHMLALVKSVMDQRAAERSYGIAEADLTPALGWSLPALRREWNRRKDTVAPWWREVSKEAFNTGLDALARALKNWADSRAGRRAGKPVGFPKFKARARTTPTVRFTTGAIRVEPDRRHVTLPRIGLVKSHESTRKLARRVEAGTARILSATVKREHGRWFVAFTVEVQRVIGRAAVAPHIKTTHPVVGVDLGVRDLAVVATPDGVEVERVPAPRALMAAQRDLRRLQRKNARQEGPWLHDPADPTSGIRREPSKRWQATQDRIRSLHATAADIRRDALAQLTTRLAQRHEIVVVETLNSSGMTARKPGAGKGGRGLNRALADASLAEVRRQLAYKTVWYGSTLVQAPRFHPSSKTCSSCGAVKAKLTLEEREFICTTCGLILDRDLNAAINLARLAPAVEAGSTTTAGRGPVAGRGADRKTKHTPPGRQPGGEREADGREASTPHKHPLDQTGTAATQDAAA